MALTAYQKAMNKALNKQPSINNPLLELAQQGATTGATPATGAANTGNLTAAQIQSLREDAKRAADTSLAASNAKTTAERNEILRQSAKQAAVKAGVPGSAQAMAATKTATPTPPVTQQPTPQQTAYQKFLESAAPQQQYLWRNMGENEMHTMDQGEQRLWQNAMQGYANGDYSAFNDNFQKAGNWGSYVDANGKVSGMLRYAGDGIGGYIPVNEGKVMQGMDPRNDYVFYGPGGEAYTMDASGNLFKTGTWTDDYDPFPKNGYYYNNPDRMFIGKDGQAYTYADVPDDKLAEWGFVRRNDGLFYEPETVARNKALANGEVTLEQLAMQDFLERGGTLPGRNTPSNNTPSGISSSGSSSVTSNEPVPTQPSEPAQPVQNRPAENESVQTGDQSGPSMYQQYLDQWDYPDAPEWEGSEYQKESDAALDRARDMRWNYDPNTDPVWQAFQKQYRREGDRATQEALAQAAMRTGGLANSYAITAASQAGDYYAAQLSDRLPQLYQDAYNRYLKEYERQMGLSEAYGAKDQTEYERYYDRLGQYNMDRNFDYGVFRDAIGDYRYDDETAYNRAEAADEKTYSRNRDTIADEKWWAQFNRQNFESDRAWEQTLVEYADSQNWKAMDWDFMLQQYGDQMDQWQKNFILQQKELKMQQDENDKNWAWKDKVFEADQQQNTTNEQKYLQEYTDEQIDKAYAFLEKYGYVAGNYAKYLGVPDGTSRKDYYKMIGYTPAEQEAYSSGGGYSGGGSSAAAPAPASTTAPTSSGNYDKALSDVRAYQNTHSTTEVLQYIKRLINEGIITDDEASQMLLYFGYVTGTGGGGSYAPGSPNNVLMTK